LDERDQTTDAAQQELSRTTVSDLCSTPEKGNSVQEEPILIDSAMVESETTSGGWKKRKTDSTPENWAPR
jgi:hypothetical protein